MRGFVVKKGTPALTVKDGVEWEANNIKRIETSKEHCFFREDIVVDPIGKIACHSGYAKTVGGNFAKRGYYGFRRDGWTLLVPLSVVEVI